MVKPKPCPFCKSTRLRVPENHSGLHVQQWFFLSVRCLDCGAEGPHSELKQYKANGDRYAHGSRRPKSAQGQQRWDATVDKAIEKAITLWNKRS